MVGGGKVDGGMVGEQTYASSVDGGRRWEAARVYCCVCLLSKGSKHKQEILGIIGSTWQSWIIGQRNGVMY